MPTVSQVRGSDTALTITLASLAASSTAGRESTAVDNTSALAVDAELYGQITTGTTPTNNTQVEVWLYASGDGTNYSGGAAGTDGALTPTTKSVLKMAIIIPVTNTSDVTHEFYIGSVANLFGGVLPAKWGVWVLNNSGVALNSTSGNHFVKYRTIKYASA